MSIRKDPSPRELRWFGLALFCFFGILGGVIAWRTGSVEISRFLWGAGALLVVTYYSVPSLRRPIFVAWMTLTYPIGWTLTHLTLGLIYYGMFTPLALLGRLLGRDSLQRSFDRKATSYWIPRPPAPPPDRYFRQF